MTANQIKGKGFRGALRYNLEKVRKGVAETLDYSFSELSEKMIIREVQMMKTKRPNLEKFFYHTSINFPPNENLPNDIMKKIANDYLQQSGFIQHQFIVFRHYDAGHPHLHILVNRIGFDGKVISDSNDYARSEKVLRALEIKYKLTQVNSSKQSKRAVTKNELEMKKRTHEPSSKVHMQEMIKEVLKTKQRMTSSEFVQALEDKGINVRFNQASTGHVSGISYSYKGITITGSKLGNDFKWTTLRNKIDYGQERDHIVVTKTKTNIILVNHIKQDIEDKTSDNMSLAKGKSLIPQNTNYVRHGEEKTVGSNPKVVSNSNLLETLIQVDEQPELSFGILLTPKKKKRKKGRAI